MPDPALTDGDFDRVLFDLIRGRSEKVADGVLAHVVDNQVWVEVRGIVADDPRVPGAVGAWLDTLPTDRSVIVPAVTSERLAGMLQRRGFKRRLWWDERIRLWDEGAWVRRPADAAD